MENLLLLMAGTYLLRQARKPVRKTIGLHRCSFLAPSAFHPQTGRTVWGDRLYQGAYYRGGQWQGIIHVELSGSLTLEEATPLLHRYMNGLHRSFGITANTGPEMAHSPAGTEGVVDYWQDASGTDWKVKGYTDGRHVTLLYVRGISHGRCASEDAFLDSLSYDPLH